MALNENPTLKEIVDEAERLNNLIVNRGGSKTITPKTSNQTLAKGYYKGNITIKGDSNLVASNILSGKSIFGVAGNVTVSSLGGRKFATGTITSKVYGSNSVGFDVRNLTFKPSIVIGIASDSTSVATTVATCIGGVYKACYATGEKGYWYKYTIKEYTSGNEVYNEYYFGSNWFKVCTSTGGTRQFIWYAFE